MGTMQMSNMNIPQSIIRPFEPLGIPKLSFSILNFEWLVKYIKGCIETAFEELTDLVDNDIDVVEPSTDHLRESLDGNQHFYQHQLRNLLYQTAMLAGADWAEAWVEMTANRDRMYAIYKVDFLIPVDEKVHSIRIAKSWDI